MVRALAARLARRGLPYALGREDLESVGMMALHDAAGRYSPKRGPLTTWAYPRIRGAMIDEIRRVNGCRYRRWTMVPIEGLDIPDERIADPCDVIDDERDRWFVNVALGSMAAGPHRLLLAFRYFFDMTWRQIGRELGITESGAWRMHKRALEACKQAIGLNVYIQQTTPRNVQRDRREERERNQWRAL